MHMADLLPSSDLTSLLAGINYAINFKKLAFFKLSGDRLQRFFLVDVNTDLEKQALEEPVPFQAVCFRAKSRASSKWLNCCIQKNIHLSECRTDT